MEQSQNHNNHSQPESNRNTGFPVRRPKKKAAFTSTTSLIRLIIVLSVILVACIFVAIACSKSPDDTSGTTGASWEVQLMGEPKVVLEYGTAFEDPGVQARLKGELVDAQVDVHMPQIQALGSYTIEYTIRYQDLTATITRTLEVVDTTAPVIPLLTKPGHCTEPGETYEEEGYTAVDNYDGDLTNQVTCTVDGNVIRYSVTDTSGNTATAERVIVYGDETAPQLTLAGNLTLTLLAGNDFAEPGFTAIDNVDGDLTHLVTVDSTYNKYVPGTYVFTYTVTDAHGNTATAERTVIVEGLTQPETVVPGQKIIYLTFDDGPSWTSDTLELLEVLERYNVKATFFVIGTSNMNYVDEIAAGGHSIGIHSYTHEFYDIYASEDAFFEDFFKLRDEIEKRTGISTTLCRFPGGSSNTISRFNPGIMTRLTAAVEAMGFQYFDWNVDSNDAGGAKTAEEVYNKVIAGVQKQNVSVVLQHDIKGFSVDAVEMIIQWGLANGYTFLPLDASSPTCHHPVNN